MLTRGRERDYGCATMRRNRAAIVLTLAALGIVPSSVADGARKHTYVPCFKSRSGVGPIVLKERPSVCLSQEINGGNAGLRDLRRLQWRKWGNSVAFASARSYDIHYGPDGTLGFQRVTVTLSKPVASSACGYRTYYSHLRVRSSIGVGDFDLAPTCDE